MPSVVLPLSGMKMAKVVFKIPPDFRHSSNFFRPSYVCLRKVVQGNTIILCFQIRREQDEVLGTL